MLVSEEARNAINDFADVVRQSFGVEVPIGDVQAVVEKLNGKLQYRELLPSDVTYAISREGDSFVIEIPRMEDVQKERFIVAQALGYLFLRMGYIVNEEVWDAIADGNSFRCSSSDNDWKVFEFASALLMPREDYYSKINKCYIGNGLYNLEDVTNYFKVSMELAANRGRWLGILAWG